MKKQLWLQNPKVASRTQGFTESVIRGMTRLAAEHDAINLAQGFPDFPAPDLVKEAAREAISLDVNQYAITWGSQRLRKAIAAKYQRWYGMDVDPDRHVTVTCGATEAMVAALMAVVDDGEEVILFEPFYENYGPDTILCGANPVFVPFESDGSVDLDRVAAAFSKRTAAIVINTPNNPSGRVFTMEELVGIGDLCRRYGAYAVTDEIYEHIYYGGKHIPMATLPGMSDQTITISGASKTFSVTGWRVGWIVAPEKVSNAIRKVHDFLTVGAPAPLQEGVAAGLEELGADFYENIASSYLRRRDLLCDGLVRAGFRCEPPAGAYYVMAEFSGVKDSSSDVEFAEWLTREVGVAPVPGSSFFNSPDGGRNLVRFAFCKTEVLLESAVSRLV